MSAPALRLPQHRAGDSSRNHDGVVEEAQYDLLASLWQEAPFVTLPADAPPELKPFVRDIENPRRVYAIHRASRRHDFQLLVQLYIHQLRDGCGVATCVTPTCFTCRKRLVGKAPIRRYNPTSARTLAIYLASQDDPERGICPTLKRPKDVPPAVNNLIFSKCSVPKGRAPKTTDSEALRSMPQPGHNLRSQNAEASSDHQDATEANKAGNTKFTLEISDKAREICISERPVTRDYRSFAATTFGTVAFKMLEWLTPTSLDALSQKISDLESLSQSNPVASKVSSPIPAQPAPDNDTHDQGDAADIPPPPPKSSPHTNLNTVTDPHSKKEQSVPKRNAKPTFRSKPLVETTRRKSIEPVCVAAENDSTALHRPTRINSYHPDKLSRRTKSPTTITLKPAFFENVPIPPPSADEVTVTSSDGEESTEEDVSRLIPLDGSHEHRQKQQSAGEVQGEDIDDAKSIAYPLPQALSQLNVELVNFICDVFAEDHTSENQFFGLSEFGLNYPKPKNDPKHLVRKSQKRDAPCKKEWKAFHEQTLFSILSDPAALVLSFTKDGNFFDSHSLWYCMVRLTRASPSLVLHSLWMSAASLFPQQGNSRRLLSMSQAEGVMSVCLHALVALVPVVLDSKTLYDLSRIRSHGLALANSSVSCRRSSSLCLEYDEVFSNSMALRLARRLFLAITVRQKHAMIPADDTGSGVDVLGLILKQLDLRNTGAERVLEFASEERLLHEIRVPTLLLDWARAVLLHEWDGKAHFYKDGTFYGALLFMDTFYANRNVLLLGEVQFRVEYFSERLDTMRVPVQWMMSEVADNVGNILEFPYLFRPETLVAYFRSINFACMSRTFEEASSLKRRMSAIVDPGSLITNPHHKVVLQDMLKTATSRYLVLDIGRATVLRDAFDQLWRRQRRELRRPLKIHLGEDAGEEGFDSGGVQQEFFRLAIAECLDPVYGAFTIDERNHMAWFKPQPSVEDWKFELMGLLLSLAVYNGLTLPVNFPKAFYRKLLGEPVDQLYHISDGWPELTSGLTTLLEWDEKDGLIEDIFARTYEFSVPGVGKDLSINMLVDKYSENPGAAINVDADLPEAPYVTNENRDDYVSDYIRYLTDYSVRSQFECFRRGFSACLPEMSLALLTPSLLQSVVEGVQEIDISELRRYTRYVGWEASHHTVRDFWSIVKRYDDRMKRKLLEFVTASDRVPVSGLRNVQFVIQKNGEEDGEGGHLPTAYTCYGTLLLPEYRDKEVLRERLSMALENAQGFGFA